MTDETRNRAREKCRLFFESLDKGMPKGPWRQDAKPILASYKRMQDLDAGIGESDPSLSYSVAMFVIDRAAYFWKRGYLKNLTDREMSQFRNWTENQCTDDPLYQRLLDVSLELGETRASKTASFYMHKMNRRRMTEKEYTTLTNANDDELVEILSDPSLARQKASGKREREFFPEGVRLDKLSLKLQDYRTGRFIQNAGGVYSNPTYSEEVRKIK